MGLLIKLIKIKPQDIKAKCWIKQDTKENKESRIVEDIRCFYPSKHVIKIKHFTKGILYNVDCHRSSPTSARLDLAPPGHLLHMKM